MCTFLRGHMASFLFSISLEVELLGPMVTLCLTFEEWPNGPKAPAPFCVPASRVRAPVSPPPRQRSFLPVFLIAAILVGIKGYLTVALVCISLMTNDVEHLFMYLSAIYVSSLKKCRLRSSSRSLIGLFVFLLLNCKILYNDNSISDT